MMTAKEVQRLDYSLDGVAYTVHVEEGENGTMWGTWNCKECGVGGRAKTSSTSIKAAVEAAISAMETHQATSHPKK